MDSDRLNRWLALAANIGVLVGIVFLAVEIRQNTIAVQTAALQQHFEQHTGLVMARVNNAELRAVFLKATDGTEMLSAEEEAILGPYIISVIRNHFVAYELRESGLAVYVRELPAADVNVTATSSATVNMMDNGVLTGTAIETSSLSYYGSNISLMVDTDLTSSVTRLGDSRP